MRIFLEAVNLELENPEIRNPGNKGPQSYNSAGVSTTLDQKKSLTKTPRTSILCQLTELSNTLTTELIEVRKKARGKNKAGNLGMPYGSCFNDWQPFLRRLYKGKTVDSAVKIPEKLKCTTADKLCWKMAKT